MPFDTLAIGLDEYRCGPACGPMVDALQKQRRKRHGEAVKQGIKKAKAHKRVLKKAALALRKAPKQAIVQRLFTPKPPPPEKGATTAD